MTTPEDGEAARKLAEELWQEEAEQQGSSSDDE